MSGEFDVIVVGGGLAGLTAAAYSCRYGYRTLLIEKTHKTGGLVNTFWHQGYAFDAGIRAFENSGIVVPMLKNLGLQMDLVRNPVSIGIEKEWTRLGTRESLEQYADMLAGIFPDNRSDIAQIKEEIRKVMNYMDVLYGIDNPLFMDNMKDREYLMKTLLPWLLKYQVNIRRAGRLSEPVAEYLKRFSVNQELIDMIVQHFFKETPTFFALSYFGLYLDYMYPKGGTGALAEIVSDYIRNNGGQILTETRVTQVDAGNNQISIEGGDTYLYKKLIWAADQKALYTTLHGTATPATERQRNRAGKGVGGDSILTLFMGVYLDKDYFQKSCGAHAFYTPVTKGLSSLSKWADASAAKESLYDWLGKYYERTTYEISCPSLRDASLAPEGKTGIIISTLMDYPLVKHLFDNDGYDEFKDYSIRKITQVLEDTVFPDISEKIEFVSCATPITIEKETGNAHGAITGWAFTNDDMPAENRFRKIAQSVKTPIENVFQCGQWTFSPSGLPVSILTGKLAADAAHKSLKGKIK